RDPCLKRDTSQLSVAQLEKALAETEPLWRYGHNDLESVARTQHPALEAMVQWLRDVGIEVRMSGAGSVFFAVCQTSQQAEEMVVKVRQAYAELLQRTDAVAELLRSLALRCVAVAAI
ncbi:hypothetical protein QP445_12320, partial [Micrococcus luteus]|nr:hypothetical protein [Micrococcus luteus]